MAEELRYSTDIEKYLKDGQIPIAILLTALHVERILRMLIELYYLPHDVKLLLENKSFKEIIDISRDLKLLKRSHWFSYFDQARQIRNDVAHKFDYWEKLSSEKEEIKRVKNICSNNLKLLKLPISFAVQYEVNDIVAKNIKEKADKFRDYYLKFGKPLRQHMDALRIQLTKSSQVSSTKKKK